MGSWIWVVFAVAVGAGLGFIGVFGSWDGWKGALIGVVIGMVAAAWQFISDRSKELGHRPRQERPDVSKVSPSPERNRRVLWQRSRHAKHAQWIFFYSVIGVVFFGMVLLVARPDQDAEVTLYGLLVLFGFAAGIYKWHAARNEVSEALHILESGVATDAQVLSLEHKQIRDSRSPFWFSMGWIASYSYVDQRGNRHFGESGFLPAKEAERYREGDRIMIAYDRDNPARSVWAEPGSLEPAPMVPQRGSKVLRGAAGVTGGESRGKRSSAIVAFAVLGVVAGVVFVYRDELGVTRVLSTSFGQDQAKRDGPDAALRAALAHYDAHRYERAVAGFKEVLRLRPDDGSVHGRLGYSYVQLDRYEEAIPHLKRAAELDPSDAFTWNNLGLAHERVGRPQQGIDALRKAAELQPKNAAILSNYGLVLRKAGRLDEALGPLLQATSLNPDDAVPHFQLGMVYAARGDRSAAQKELAIVRSRDPDMAVELEAALR